MNWSCVLLGWELRAVWVSELKKMHGPILGLHVTSQKKQNTKLKSLLKIYLSDEMIYEMDHI